MLSGIILLDKEAGMTSRAVDNAIGRAFMTRRVGHLGTLDPFATGLLLIAVNKATKYLPFLPDGFKTYEAELALGKKTSTGDPTGEVVEEKTVPNLDEKQIEGVFASFLGVSYQIPPMTSAIKVEGKALYELAHKGLEVERKKREIEIKELQLLAYEKGIIRFSCLVSKGTYVRTLGEDIAKALGTVGFLVSLRRTKIGEISVQDAVRLSDLREEDLREPSAFVDLPRLEVNEKEAMLIKNGVKMALDREEKTLLLTYQGEGLAVYEKEGGSYRCVRGLF